MTSVVAASNPAGVLLAAFTACALTWALTPIVRAAAVRFGWVSRPVHDRWGRRVIARLGGVAIFAGWVTAVTVWQSAASVPPGLVAGGALVFLLGLIDDIRRLTPYTKLVGQLLVGCVAVFGGVRIDLLQWTWLAIPLSILWVVLLMNAFNLLDNMDGLAAGVGAVASAFCALHAGLTGQWAVALVAASLSGACAGFLRYNFPPGCIFMGDSGSHLLGTVLASLALMGNWTHSTQLLSILAVPTLLLALPIFDTCFVTVQRLAHGQHPFVGGTDHISHRMAVLGLSERQTVLVLYAVSGCLGLLSLLATQLHPISVLAVCVFALAVLVLFGRYLAKVKVYRLPSPDSSGAPPSRPVTLIGTMLLHKRRVIEVVLDFCLLSSGYVLAYLLRFEGVLSDDQQQLIIQSLPIILGLKLLAFAGFGLYRGVWRYVGIADLLTIFKAATFSSLLSAVALLFLWRFEGYSRAVIVIDWMLSMLLISGSRVIERLLDEWIHQARSGGVPVIVIGAGDTGARVLRMLRDDRDSRVRVIGVLDDDASTWGNRLLGASVLGPRSRLAELLDAHSVREVLVAIEDPPGEVLQHLQELCGPRGVTWRVVTAGIRDVV